MKDFLKTYGLIIQVAFSSITLMLIVTILNSMR